MLFKPSTRRKVAMKRAILVCLMTLVTAAMFVEVSLGKEQALMEGIKQTRSGSQPHPIPSSILPELTEDKAYTLQRLLTEELVGSGMPIRGYKAGLTTEQSQKRFGAKSPVLGPLFKQGELAPRCVVDSKDYHRLIIEMEIGYIAAARIDKPVPDVGSLRKLIKEVCPAVELPDIRFAEMKGITEADLIVLIAGAVSSAKYVVGERVPVDSVDLSKVKVGLTQDGFTVNEGRSQDAMGDQWNALLWLVNGTISRGYIIEPGHLMITGAVGHIVPGKPGHYDGIWSGLGKISWTIK